eukprot:3890207-Rhodomonas_salina.6
MGDEHRGTHVWDASFGFARVVKEGRAAPHAEGVDVAHVVRSPSRRLQSAIRRGLTRVLPHHVDFGVQRAQYIHSSQHLIRLPKLVVKVRVGVIVSQPNTRARCLAPALHNVCDVPHTPVHAPLLPGRPLFASERLDVLVAQLHEEICPHGVSALRHQREATLPEQLHTRTE